MKTFMLWLLSVGMLVSGFLLYEHHKAIVRLSLENGRLHRQLYARTITLDQLERRMFLLVGDLETLSDEVLERCRTKENDRIRRFHGYAWAWTQGGYMTSNHYTKECTENDSIYRLEKNDITGECRVMEKQKICRFESWSAGYKWVEIVNDQTYDCPNWSNCSCKRWPEERLIKYLGKLRAKEQADKAWRPIR